MEIVQIEKVNFVTEVCKQLREMIVSGTWPEGTKIASENELAKQFHVSRVVIREALQILRSEKLVVTRHGVGSFVANPNNFLHPDSSLQLSVEVYQRFVEFRNAVEIAAIQLSAAHATEDDYAHIWACLDDMAQCKEDAALYAVADYRFHLAVVKSSHNEFLERAMQTNENALTSVFKEMNSLPESQRYGVTSHTQIYEALRMHDIKRVIGEYHKMSEYNLARLSRFFSANS